MQSPPPEEPSDASNLIPTYINVERMDPNKQSDSFVSDSMSVSPPEESEPAAPNKSDGHYELITIHQLEGEDVQQQKEEISSSTTEQKEDVHFYANIELKEGVSKPKSAPSSPKKPKKPMPMKRKQGEGESRGTSSLSSSLEITNSSESNSSPPVRPKTPQKPLPPVKPQKPLADDTSTVKEEKPPPLVSTPKLNQLIKKPVPEKLSKPKTPESKSTDRVTERRSRSKTTIETGSEKKQPLLPPLKPVKEAKTTDSLPTTKESEPPSNAATASPVVHHSPLKPKLSEPTRSKVMTGSAQVDSSTHAAREELMRKLSQRRQRIEQQLGAHKVTPCKPNIGNVETASERNSTISSSSSEVVVSYSTRAEESSPPNGAAKSGGDTTGVAVRTKPENESLAKYGIIEDTEGGSFVV